MKELEGAAEGTAQAEWGHGVRGGMLILLCCLLYVCGLWAPKTEGLAFCVL